MKLSIGARNLIGNLLCNAIDSGGGFDLGTLAICSGPVPASANDAETGVRLATINLPTTPFEQPVDGAVLFQGSWVDPSVDAPGVAAYWRLYQRGDNGGALPKAVRLQGLVGAPGTGSEMEIAPSLMLTAGQRFAIVSMVAATANATDN